MKTWEIFEPKLFSRFGETVVIKFNSVGRNVALSVTQINFKHLSAFDLSTVVCVLRSLHFMFGVLMFSFTNVRSLVPHFVTTRCLSLYKGIVMILYTFQRP